MHDSIDFLNHWLATMAQNVGINFEDAFEFETKLTSQCTGNCGLSSMIDKGTVMNVPQTDTFIGNLELLYKDVTMLELKHKDCNQSFNLKGFLRSNII